MVRMHWGWPGGISPWASSLQRLGVNFIKFYHRTHVFYNKRSFPLWDNICFSKTKIKSKSKLTEVLKNVCENNRQKVHRQHKAAGTVSPRQPGPAGLFLASLDTPRAARAEMMRSGLRRPGLAGSAMMLDRVQILSGRNMRFHRGNRRQRSCLRHRNGGPTWPCTEGATRPRLPRLDSRLLRVTSVPGGQTHQQTPRSPLCVLVQDCQAPRHYVPWTINVYVSYVACSPGVAGEPLQHGAAGEKMGMAESQVDVVWPLKFDSHIGSRTRYFCLLPLFNI